MFYRKLGAEGSVGQELWHFVILNESHFYAPNFEKVGGHIGFGLSVCMYVRTYVCMYVFMFEISS